jgi:hypothetical protein
MVYGLSWQLPTNLRDVDGPCEGEGLEKGPNVLPICGLKCPIVLLVVPIEQGNLEIWGDPPSGLKMGWGKQKLISMTEYFSQKESKASMIVVSK